MYTMPFERWCFILRLVKIFCRLCLFVADFDAEERAREEKEMLVENDDEEALQKAKDWDNWKDTHRRGYGNRKNMG